MKSLNLDEVFNYVENNIGSFHSKRLENLNKLKFSQILKRKNPYLFKAKYILTAPDFVKTLLDSHLSSQEETIFGNFLEGLAIFINGKVYGGKKSSAEGIDLEFENNDIRYIVSIKSGPNWGNSSAINKMKDDFKKAQKILRTSDSKMQIIAINGCCYGENNKQDMGEYFKYCGERFWTFISENDHLFIDIIEPLGHKAKINTEKFGKAYAKVVNNFTYDFTEEFCTNGEIDWERIVRLNSAIK